jgi:hypothetical protein
LEWTPSAGPLPGGGEYYWDGERWWEWLDEPDPHNLVTPPRPHGHPGRTGGIKNNPDGSPKDPGQQYEEILNAPKTGYKKGAQKSKQDAQREDREQAEQALDDLRKKRATECAEAAGWGFIIVSGLYWTISEGSRILCPPRNLIPVP